MSEAIATIQSMDNEKTINSREVAEMLGKRHRDLLETIKIHSEHLLSGNFRSMDYFILSHYKDGIGRTLPCYEITRKGCELVANKMAGAKGTQFTAAYVERFHQMEGVIATPSELILQSIEHIKLLAQSNVETEKRVNALTAEVSAVNNKIDTAIQTFLTATPENWRGSMERQLKELCVAAYGQYPNPNLLGRLYADMESAAGIDLDARLRNLKRRMKKHAGLKYKEAKELTKLDVISRDRQLKAIFEGVLKKYQARYCLGVQPVEVEPEQLPLEEPEDFSEGDFAPAETDKVGDPA